MSAIDHGPIFGAELLNCVACNSTKLEAWESKTFSYTLGRSDQSFAIARCRDCGTGFLNPPPHRDFLSRIYAYSGHALRAPISLVEVIAAERKFPNSTVDAKRMVAIADGANRSGVRRALDVGSGYGFGTRELISAGYDTVSINPGEYENAVFEEMNGHRPVVTTFEAYEDKAKFGLIFMSQVLEHIILPSAAIAKAAALLCTGGVLACAVPNFRSISVRLLGTRDNSCLWVPEHVNYFTLSGLDRLLRRHGLEPIRSDMVTRVRYDALSRRLRAFPFPVLLDLLVRYAQVPIAWAVNAAQCGFYINTYAVKT